MLTPQTSRKSSAVLTLALMGGVALIALNSCDEDEQPDDGVFYASPLECINAGNSAQVCNDAWNTAKENFAKEVPANFTREACEKSYGSCYLDNITGSWSPIMMGFLLANAVQQNRNDNYTSSTGSYTSRPVWSNSHGDYVWRRSTSWSSDSGQPALKSSSTVSRGGFGRSSSARGSWGG
ncbi:DUF1190 domain-containing protein [Atlantibacter hermannii]|uniref:DUF1190 domain-containing protein n=1 Tax=Atlantibacter hermannii TaxID=565 RepID=UPI00289D2233|nr:DUF1190 domain-containing protein [Atlantibacter hermannii]